MHIKQLKNILIIFVSMLIMLGCGSATKTSAQSFVSITQQQAKQIMDKEKDYIVLDVRNADEYRTGHIPKAVFMPLPMLDKIADKKLPNKKQLILVYCRSGRRSKEAAKILVSKGYTNIKEFGGIIDWPYEIEK